MMKTPPLLIFVHGFLGESSRTFQDFPKDLQSALEQEYHFPTDTALYNYESQGTDQVHRLLDFLLNRVAESPSRPIVLLAHSMGGILSLDVLRESRLQLDLELPLAGILAFDTPFFGLHPNVLLDSGMKRVGAATSSFVNAVSSVLPPSSSSTTRRSSSSTSSTDRSHSGSNLWMGLAAGVAAAAFTGYSMYQSLDPDSKEKVKQVTRSHTERLNGHLDFLGPLWKNVGDMNLRFRDLRDLMNRKPGISFHCLYTKIHPTGSTFISAPPAEYSHLFSHIAYHSPNVTDEIDAHSHMFFRDREPLAYSQLLQQSVSWIQTLFLQKSL